LSGWRCAVALHKFTISKVAEEIVRAVYSECNIGPLRCSFRISSQIDQDKIKSRNERCVITLTLPKAEEAKPRLAKEDHRSAPVVAAMVAIFRALRFLFRGL
jgi:hypothetical protein